MERNKTVGKMILPKKSRRTFISAKKRAEECSHSAAVPRIIPSKSFCIQSYDAMIHNAKSKTIKAELTVLRDKTIRRIESVESPQPIK
jgi:hypothetical protein